MRHRARLGVRRAESALRGGSSHDLLSNYNRERKQSSFSIVRNGLIIDITGLSASKSHRKGLFRLEKQQILVQMGLYMSFSSVAAVFRANLLVY